VPLRCTPRMQMALGFLSTSFIALDPIFLLTLSSGPTREQLRNH
jgi:hypothetical protein